MKKTLIALVFSLFLLFITLKANIQSDGPIMLTLKIPPPEKLNLENFWGVTLTNNSGSEQSVYLVGAASESKAGQIVKGTTVPFLLKTGTTILRIKDLPKTPDIEYTASNPMYKESLARTGDFPEGQYEICVKVFSAGNNEELGSDCINQEVGQLGLLSLINPIDGHVIDSKSPLVFSWSTAGKMPEGGFTLKICEVSKGQSPESAMKSNRLFFEKAGIKSSPFQYPNSAKAFEDGKMYAWMVSAIDRGKEVASSEVGSFSRQACGVLMITNKVTCTGGGSNIYNYLLTFENLSNPATDPTCIVSVTSITITGILFTMSGLPTINPGQTISVSGTIGPTSLASGNFTVNATSPGFTGTWNVPFIFETVPAMPVVTGLGVVCQGQSGYIYSMPAMGGFITYHWNVTGGTINSGQGTSSIAVTFTGSSGNVCATTSNSCGTSTPNCKTIIITVPSTSPVPTAIAATGVGQNGFTANWNAVNGATGYYLDVATNPSFTSPITGFMGLATSNPMIGLICNTNYYYRVRAVGVCSGISTYSNVITVHTSPTYPPPPTAFAATGIQASQFTASWTPVSGVFGYCIDVYTIGAGGSLTYMIGYNNKSVGNVTTYTVTGLNYSTTYHYRVRAIVLCGVSASSYSVTVNTTQPVLHGLWTRGPGTYSFTVGAQGTAANINRSAGQSIPITMEVWGAGGGGGSGEIVGGTNGEGGDGGGGGGGGGYATTTINVIVPLSGTVKYYIRVGSGGTAGQLNFNNGGNGEFSEVRLNNSTGYIVLIATGGIGGIMGNDSHSGSGRGGNGGSGTLNNWSGLKGGDGAIDLATCNGGSGGLGGPGGGPNRSGPGYFNDGGNGGHGGYYRNLVDPTCVSASANYQLEPGAAGGNGRVVFTW